MMQPKNSEARLESWRRYNAKRRADPEKAASAREMYRAWRKTNPVDADERARKAADMRRYRKAHGTRDHHLARAKVKQAIASGQLVRQPCEVCGAKTAHAHHDDYSRSLVVRWLCPPHHRAHHAKATGAPPDSPADLQSGAFK